MRSCGKTTFEFDSKTRSYRNLWIVAKLNFNLLFVDVIDVVKDAVECSAEEDPTVYVSEKTGRGPLTVNWLEEYSQVCISIETCVGLGFLYILFPICVIILIQYVKNLSSRVTLKLRTKFLNSYFCIFYADFVHVWLKITAYPNLLLFFTHLSIYFTKRNYHVIIFIMKMNFHIKISFYLFFFFACL